MTITARIGKQNGFPVTSPRGEDRMIQRGYRGPAGFQSPPREGRIEGREMQERTTGVSSHLPARGGSLTSS